MGITMSESDIADVLRGGFQIGDYVVVNHDFEQCGAQEIGRVDSTTLDESGVSCVVVRVEIAGGSYWSYSMPTSNLSYYYRDN